jgi:hypothetical protein
MGPFATRAIRADEGDKGAEEHHEGQREGEWDPEDRQRDPDDQGVHEGDDGGAADIAPEHVDRARPDQLQPAQPVAGGRRQEELPDPSAVFEQEEQDDDSEEQPGDGFGGCGRTLQRTRGHRLALEQLDRGVTGRVDLLGLDGEGPGGEELLQLGQTLAGPALQLVPLRADARHHDPPDTGEGGEPTDQGDPDRKQPRQATTDQERHERADRRCQQGGDEDRHHDEPQSDHDGRYQRGRGQQEQHLGAANGHPSQSFGPR